MSSLEQQFNKAVAKLRAGQIKPAEKILLQIEKRQRGIPDVLHMLGYIALETDRPAVAVKHLKQAVEKVPGNVELLNLLGAAHYRAGNAEAAIACFSKVLSAAPAMDDARFNLADALLDARRFEDAAGEYRKLVESNPDTGAGHLGLGCALWQTGDQDGALEAFSTALEKSPDDPAIHLNMGRAQLHGGNLGESLRHALRAVELDAGSVAAKLLQANVLVAMEDPATAITVLQDCLTLAPEGAETHRLLGTAHQLTGQGADAFASFEKARALRPDDTETLQALSVFLEKSNRLDEASDAVSDGLKIDPDHFGLRLIAARLAARSNDHAKALEILDALDDRSQPLELQRDRFYELGKVYDRLGRIDDAYKSFETANGVTGRIWQAPHARKEVMIDYVKRHHAVVTQPWLKTWSKPFAESGDMQAPVFMVGFPRSGTTLMGQILDSHPDLQVLDEPPTIDRVRAYLLEQDRAYPDCLAGLSTDDIAQLRRVYFKTARDHVKSPEGVILVDKMPLNLVEAPLIVRMFPDARFILCLRHPCDACLSCFMQFFEMNAGMSNFLNLEDTARLYENVMSLWHRYETLIPLNILSVRYEDLVGDMEGTTSAMLEFLGVPWNDAVMAYYQRAAGQAIQTPSYSQVTQQIYTSARYRWLRYEKFLSPALDRLQPFIDRYGYSEKNLT